MAATVNAVCAPKRFLEIKYFNQRYLLLQFIKTYTNIYRRMFPGFR